MNTDLRKRAEEVLAWLMNSYEPSEQVKPEVDIIPGSEEDGWPESADYKVTVDGEPVCIVQAIGDPPDGAVCIANAIADAGPVIRDLLRYIETLETVNNRSSKVYTHSKNNWPIDRNHSDAL